MKGRDGGVGLVPGAIGAYLGECPEAAPEVESLAAPE